MDPDSGAISVYRDGSFVPFAASHEPPDGEPLPSAASSEEWYRGKMDHLPLARIGA
jgi:hypothetical protein